MIVALLCAALGFVIFRSEQTAAVDFRAFYCAGKALHAHADPYRSESLHACEADLSDRVFKIYGSSTTVPAPLPPYDTAALSALSLLPYDLAKPLWGAMLALAVAITLAALLRLTGMTVSVVFCALMAPLIAPSLSLGQIVPLYMAAVTGAMVLIQERRYGFAALAASASLVEPHLGIPVCISLALWQPRMRRPLILLTAALAIVSLWGGGFAQNVEYVTKALPFQALAEAAADGQLSFTALLHGLGVPDTIAAISGTASYFILGAIGIIVGKLAADRFSNNSFLAAVPAAASVLGGSYVHTTDIVAAVPLALLLVSRTSAYRSAAAFALMLLVMPWWLAWDNSSSYLYTEIGIASATSAYVFWGATKNTPLAIACAVLLFALLFEITVAYDGASRAFLQSSHAAPVYIDPAYPQASWARAVQDRFATGAPVVWLVRMLTWVGLAITIGIAAAREPDQRTETVALQ